MKALLHRVNPETTNGNYGNDETQKITDFWGFCNFDFAVLTVSSVCQSLC